MGDLHYLGLRRMDAAKTALTGWHLNSEPHLDAACDQLLALLSVRFFGHEVAAWYRPRCVPSADLLTTYGREQQAVFFNAMIAACALGPNMADALTPEELHAVNAHLYRYAVTTSTHRWTKRSTTRPTAASTCIITRSA